MPIFPDSFGDVTKRIRTPLRVIPGATYVPNVSIAPSFAGGMFQIYPTFTGALARVTRRSDTSTLSINPVSGGQQADVSTLTAFTAGTTVGTDTLYDQSGSGNDHTNTNGASGPSIYIANAIGPYQPLTNGIITQGSTAGGIGGTGLTNTLLATQRQSVTVVTVIAIGGGTFNSEGLWSLGTSSTVANNLQLLYDTTSSKAQCYILGNTFQNNSFTPDTAKFAVISVKTTTSSTIIRMNGTVVATGGGTTAIGLTGSYLGHSIWSSSQGCPSDILAHLVYPGTLPDTDLLAVEQALMTIVGISATKTKTLAWDGDSLTCGLNESEYLRNLPRQINASIGGNVYTPNFGISGQTAQQVYSRQSTTLAQTPTTGKTSNVVHVWMGTNDIDTATTTGISTTVYNNYIVPYVQAAIAAGRSVVVGTIIPRGWLTSGIGIAAKETERQNLNSLIVSGASANGYTVADYGGISALTTGAANNPPNPSYYGQSTAVHVNPTGYGLLTNLLLPIVQPLLV